MLASCTEASRAALEVEPTEIDLGVMTPGESRSVRLLVRSTGGAPLRIEDITASDPAIGIEAFVGVELAPGGIMEAIVRFDALRAGALAARVIIDSSAGAIEVPITGSVGSDPSDGGVPDGGNPPDGGDAPDGGGFPDASPCVPIFAEPATVGVTEDQATYEESPSIATDGAGTWIAVFISDDSFSDQVGFDPDVFFSRSIDDGLSWSPAEPLSLEFAMLDGDRADQRPEIEWAGGTWMVVWQVDLDPGNGLATIYASSSLDGLTFSPPYELATEEADAVPSVAGDGESWIVAWHAHALLGGAAGTDGDVSFSRSDDSGATWTPVAALNTHAMIDSDWDGEVSLESTAPGRYIAVWRSNHQSAEFGPDPDILFARSSDGGRTWDDARAVSRFAADEMEADHDPALAADGQGNVVVTWRTEDPNESVMVAHSSDDGATWRDPIVAGFSGASDANLSVATDRAGTFVIAWHSHLNVDGSGTDGDILGIISIDGGITWSTPSPLNVNAAGDQGDDYAPWIASDGAQWMVVFQTNAPTEMILGARGMCE